MVLVPATDDALRPGRELLTASLLALLDERATYGYKLQHALDALGLSIDPGTMYRRLGRLEDYGWVQSRWASPGKGPRRRLYRLTPKGRRALDEIAGLIQTISDAHEAFVLAYDEQRRQPEIIRTGVAGAPKRPPKPEAAGYGGTLLTAWLLALLDRGANYGYVLARQLAAACPVEPSVLYRRLRVLEERGCVASHWGSPVSGPRRRIYELTPEGRAELDTLAARSRAQRSAMRRFLESAAGGSGAAEPPAPIVRYGTA